MASLIIDRAYYLNPIRGISDQQRVELAKQQWLLSNEHLWQGEIDVNLLHLDGASHFDKILKRFCQFDLYNHDIKPLSRNLNESDVEQVCKTVFLTDAYLSAGSFRDPICAHYNPRWGKNVVHPGGTRQIVLDVFHSGNVNTFYFNTGGFDFDFLTNMEKIDIDQFFVNGKYLTDLVPDHGTFIPHTLRPTMNELTTNQNIFHDQIKNKLGSTKFKIYSNIDLEHFVKWQDSRKGKASVRVHFNNPDPHLKIKIKAYLLVLRGKDYEDTDLSVVHKRKSKIQ